MKLRILLLLPCFCAVLSCTPKQPAAAEADTAQLTPAHCEQTIRAFSEAILKKDTALWAKSASPAFGIAIASWPSAYNYLQPALNHAAIDSIVPAVDSLIVTPGSFKQKTGAWVYVSGKEPVKTTVAFDGRDGKILYLDYFDHLFGYYRNRPSRLKAVLPMEQTEGDSSIVITLKLNNSDKPLRFLFDTGADGMAISSALAQEVGIKAGRSQQTSVVGGNMQINISQNNTVWLDTLPLPGQNIAIFDNVRHGADGIIGLNLAKNHIVQVQFDEKKIYLYSFGDHTYPTGGETESITVPHGVIIIPGYLNLTGEKTVNGRFVFDTGADYYFMGFSPFVRTNRLLLSGFKPERESATVSLGITTPVFEGKTKEFGFGEKIRQTDMPVSLQASTGNNNWKPQADASVGIRLLSQYNFTINLLEKEIHFQPR